MKKNRITSVCCVCGTHLRGPWPPSGALSHGLCEPHLQQALREVAEFLGSRKQPDQQPMHATEA